jgi:hypothetical protein
MNTSLDVTKIVLKSGQHDKPKLVSESAEMCFMEAVSLLAGEKWTDHPKCVCDSFGFLRGVNDRIRDDALRTRALGPLYFVVLGTKSSESICWKRTWLLRDWTIRTELVRLFRRVKRDADAERVASLAEIVDDETLQRAREALREIRDAARTERSAKIEELRKRSPAIADIADIAASAASAAIAASAASADIADIAAIAAIADIAAIAAIADIAASAASAAIAAIAASADIAASAASADIAASAKPICEKLVAIWPTLHKIRIEQGYWPARDYAYAQLRSLIEERVKAEYPERVEEWIASLQGIVKRMAAVSS